jgi:hypothetical protein
MKGSKISVSITSNNRQQMVLYLDIFKKISLSFSLLKNVVHHERLKDQWKYFI